MFCRRGCSGVGLVQLGVWLSLSGGINRVVSVFTGELVCAQFLVGLALCWPGNLGIRGFLAS